MNKRVSLTIHIESAGNATIRDGTGQTVGVIEGWTLFVNGDRLADVSTYHEAIDLTRTALEKRT